MTKPQAIRVPITVDLLEYIQHHNIEGETYGRTVQRIVAAAKLDNLTPAPPRELKHDRPWTSDEDAAALDTTRTYREIAEDIRRSPQAVANRRLRLRRQLGE